MDAAASGRRVSGEHPGTLTVSTPSVGEVVGDPVDT